MKKSIVLSLLLAGGALSGVAQGSEPLNSDSILAKKLESVLSQHELMSVVDSELMSARETLQSEKYSWAPTLTLTGEYGREHLYREVGGDTKLTPSVAQASLTQPLWDFGAISSRVEKAEQSVYRKELERNLQEQNLLLAALEAYINLYKAYRVSAYSIRSEENIKNQTRLENTRISKGKGYATDVLQAKAQLAGAQAKRVSAEQALSAARNRYYAIFRSEVPSASEMLDITEPTALLPQTLEELLDKLRENNPDVLRDRASVRVAEAEKDRIYANGWMPSLDLVLTTAHKRNQDGVEGDRDSNEVSVQFSWDINLAGQANKSVKAAVNDIQAQQFQADYTLVTVTEDVRNAWTDLQLARERADYLRDQVAIADRFVSLARKERELGRRSLIDVLSGETSLINAQGEYSAAQADVVIQSYRILRGMGKLSLQSVVLK